MSFRLVPTSMTLNDLERRNSPYFAFFSLNSIALQADYVTVAMSVKYCLSVPVFHFWPKLRTLQRGLSAIAEHLVISRSCVRLNQFLSVVECVLNVSTS